MSLVLLGMMAIWYSRSTAQGKKKKERLVDRNYPLDAIERDPLSRAVVLQSSNRFPIVASSIFWLPMLLFSRLRRHGFAVKVVIVAAVFVYPSLVSRVLDTVSGSAAAESVEERPNGSVKEVCPVQKYGTRNDRVRTGMIRPWYRGHKKGEIKRHFETVPS